jgi:hypothetical protein
MQHPLTHQVSNVSAAPAQKAQILDPLDRGADVAIDGGHD